MNSCKKFIIYNIQRKRIHRNDCGSRKFLCDDGGKRPYLLNSQYVMYEHFGKILRKIQKN